MIYCTCGGQKTCFKCDGKGWIDEPEAGAEDASVVFPPVLEEYSRMPEPSTEKFDAGRKKPLIAQVKGGFSIPRSSSNMEAASLKARKLAKAAKKAAALAAPEKPDQPIATQQKASGISHGKGKGPGKSVLRFLTDEQRSLLVEHEQKLAKLTEVLPGAGDAADQVALRILDEKRAIRKLQSKARRIKKKQKATSGSGC